MSWRSVNFDKFYIQLRQILPYLNVDYRKEGMYVFLLTLANMFIALQKKNHVNKYDNQISGNLIFVGIQMNNVLRMNGHLSCMSLTFIKTLIYSF